MQKLSVAKNWFIYIAKCADGTLYTGISVNVERRIKTHNSGRGAFYTKNKRPVVMVYTETCEDQSTALKREREIKKWRKEKKLKLIETFKIMK